MKRQVIAFLFITAVLAFSCTVSEKELSRDPEGAVELRFVAGAPSSKVLLDSSHACSWEDDDEISVEGNRFIIIDNDGTTAVFSGTVSAAQERYLAVLPWSDGLHFSGKTVTGSLPSKQVAKEGACSYPLSYALSEGNSLSFHHLDAAVQFTLGSDMTGVREIVFRGNSGEVIAGEFALALNDSGNVTSFTSGGSATSVSLSGDIQAGRTYCLNILGTGVNFSSGLSLEFLFNDGSAGMLTSSKSLIINGGGVDKSILFHLPCGALAG